MFNTKVSIGAEILAYYKNEELPSSQLSVMRVITLKESFDTSPYYQILI